MMWSFSMVQLPATFSNMMLNACHHLVHLVGLMPVKRGIVAISQLIFSIRTASMLAI